MSKYDYAILYLRDAREKLRVAIKYSPKNNPLILRWKEELESTNSAIEVLREKGK